ncbi:chitin-binding domain protein cbd-1-like [Anopheles albimanus]|uniref:Chitin-binding type-2 domain-containing protein n=1 Tax=Anopheles albimanus TaxID=7167 RepID=A0A182FXL8_ANOAL|nr:chitin-binding domain protein cbd-1-like [Anopheles albimanus]
MKGLVWSVAIVCSLAVVANAFFCDGIPGGMKLRFPLPEICNEYISCHHGTEHEWRCPMGRFFSQRAQRCQATCDPSEAINICAGLLNGIRLRPPLSEFPFPCTRYYECIGGNMITRECPAGTFFSQLDQGCGSVREEFCI